MDLFSENITCWEDWGRVFQSIPKFRKLVQHILEKEGLPPADIKNLTPGTNAVFRVGDYVIKIFAPPALGYDFGTNIKVELFGLRWAATQNVPAPRLIAHGAVQDKYLFKYIIMDYIAGQSLDKLKAGLADQDKITIGRKIRTMADALNRPCENFTEIDMMAYALADAEWEDEGFPASFQQERLEYVREFGAGPHRKVYCHGDFHGGNILVTDNLDVYLVDFADAMYAPAEYELAYIFSALFAFEKPYMVGFFGGDYNTEAVVDLCMAWLPIHVWGHATIVEHLKPVAEIDSFDTLRRRLSKLV